MGEVLVILGKIIAEGGGGIGKAAEAIGFVALGQWLIEHPQVALGAAAVVVWLVIAEVKKSVASGKQGPKE